MSRMMTILGAMAIISMMVLVASTPLDDYVNKPDPAYQWNDTGIRFTGPACTFAVLNMTSQSWLSRNDWNYAWGPNGGTWWHYILVAIPDVITIQNKAFLYITGGSNQNFQNIPNNTTRDASLLVSMGVELGMVAAAVYHVPNQPITFTSDPKQASRSEDAILAYSWDKFMANNQPEWIARLPMTKAAVRAMDSVVAFAAKERKIGISQYIVGGASKRGWTSWTTAAVDKRVVGTIPMVMDELNFIENIHHHYRAYGGWSFALDDYFEANLTRRFDDPALRRLMDIEDPIMYASRLMMPKLVVCAGGDEFFLPDDQLYFWEQLKGDTYSLMLGNTGHSLAPVYPTMVAAAQSFAWSIVNMKTRPQFTWTHDSNTGTIVVKSQDEPTAVNLWYAFSAAGTGRRDFRIAAGWPTPAAQSVPWLSSPLSPSAPGVWTVQAPVPPTEEGEDASSRWTAFFVECLFGAAPRVFRFTTNAYVHPDTFPYAPCEGEGCYGKLL